VGAARLHCPAQPRLLHEQRPALARLVPSAGAGDAPSGRWAPTLWWSTGFPGRIECRAVAGRRSAVWARCCPRTFRD